MGNVISPVQKPLVVSYRPVGDLVPYANNARKHTGAQVAKIAASIREFGWTNPILVDGANGVVAGHGRIMAAQALGHASVPVIELAGLTDAQRRAYILADNRLALDAEWDDELLAAELAGLRDDDGFDIDLIGFSEAEMAALMPPGEGGKASDGEIVTPPAVPKTKRGDVWTLGPHRIMCGDCRNSADVVTLLDGVRVNLAFTSPPYAEQREYDHSSGFTPIHPDDYVGWFADVAGNVKANLAPDGSWFVNIKPAAVGLDTSLYVLDLVIAHVREWGWHFATEYCWERVGVPKQVVRRFKNQFEPIYQFALGDWKMRPDAMRHASENVPTAGGPGVGDTSWGEGQGSGASIFGAARKRAHGSKDNIPTAQGTNWEPGEYIKPGLAYPGNRLPSFSGSHDALGHAAAFPVGLPRFFVNAYTDEGDAVFDPFIGSGSTLMAAHAANRKGYGMEISPAYCDIIVIRWQTATGEKAMNQSGVLFDDLVTGSNDGAR